MPSESLWHRPRLGQPELTKRVRCTDNRTAVTPTQFRLYPCGGTCSLRPVYLPSRVICLLAKSSGHGRLFRQRLFLGSATLSWSTLLLRSSRPVPCRIGLRRAERI